MEEKDELGMFRGKNLGEICFINLRGRKKKMEGLSLHFSTFQY